MSFFFFFTNRMKVFSERTNHLFVWSQQRKTCGTGQDEMSDGRKCFQQLLLQWVEHIQSIPKQIKSSGQSEWEKLQRTGRQSHTHKRTVHIQAAPRKLAANTLLNYSFINLSVFLDELLTFWPCISLLGRPFCLSLMFIIRIEWCKLYVM